jgi:serine/threonine protein kinase
MPAHLIVCGESPPGVGGEFEDECVRVLVAKLPEPFTVVRNVSLPRGGGAYYEYDAIVIGPKGWEILEFKCIRPFADVYEDHISGTAGFVAERVFSRLDNKAKVLATRKAEPRFETQDWQRQRITTAVVLPSQTTVTFREKGAAARPVVRSIDDAALYFVAQAQGLSPDDRKFLGKGRAAWAAFAAKSAPGSQRSPRYMGRYLIRRRLQSSPGTFAYHAMDEPPCPVDVHLKEYSLDPTLSRAALDRYIAEVSREMLTLRRVRHPSVSCVIGHFSTGGSLVQVSDWFDGRRLEEAWESLKETSVAQRIGLCYRIASGLAYCHEKGVFHRNLTADSVLVSDDFEDLRVTSFELARDLDLTSTLSEVKLAARNARVIPPEELGHRSEASPRLGDVYQMGILFYRIVEAGSWPFEDPLEFATDGGNARPMTRLGTGSSGSALGRLVADMLSVDPKRRPDPLQRVEAALRSIAGS